MRRAPPAASCRGFDKLNSPRKPPLHNSDIVRIRLGAHRLVGTRHATAVEAVTALTAVQSQDYGAAKWALGQRTAGTTGADLDAAFDAGAILRTHAMRPTWHFVTPDDVRWIQDLTGPRLLAALAGRWRRLELDPETRSRATELIVRALTGAGRHLTRTELGGALLDAGISPEGQRLPHLLMEAEVRGVIISGVRLGHEHTYALLDERAPQARRLDREEALAELTFRYFRSHGPARREDFAWWSGLTIADVRLGLVLARNLGLECFVQGDVEYWFAAGLKPVVGGPHAHLLPNFDEFTVAYRDRSALIDPALPFEPALFPYFRPSSPEGRILSNVVLSDGRVRGAWRRTTTRRGIGVDVWVMSDLDLDELKALELTVGHYGRFLERPVALRLIAAEVQPARRGN